MRLPDTDLVPVLTIVVIVRMDSAVAVAFLADLGRVIEEKGIEG